MLNAAMVLMILAGIFGLPAVLCSGFCAGLGQMAGAEKGVPEGQAIVEFLMYLSIAASLGSIIVGALVKRLKKVTSGLACFIFAIFFAFLLVQGNVFGLVSSLMLVIAGVMIFVAPSEQFERDLVVDSQKLSSAKSKGLVFSTPTILKERTTIPAYCTQCGTRIASDSRFCEECGSLVE